MQLSESQALACLKSVFNSARSTQFMEATMGSGNIPTVKSFLSLKPTDIAACSIFIEYLHAVLSAFEAIHAKRAG